MSASLLAVHEGLIGGRRGGWSAIESVSHFEGSLWLACKGLIARVTSPVIIGRHETAASEWMMEGGVDSWNGRLMWDMAAGVVISRKKNILTLFSDRESGEIGDNVCWSPVFYICTCFDLVPRGEEDLWLFSGELDLLGMATSVNLND